MLSFLLKQIWTRFNDFLLNILATFVSVLGMQVTVRLQVNSELQPLIRWELSVAGTLLRRPKPTKERVEPTILSIMAIEITHLAMFTLLLLLRIQRYVWRNHVATWFSADNSGRILDLNKIRFSLLHYILLYSFWIGFADLNL